MAWSVEAEGVASGTRLRIAGEDGRLSFRELFERTFAADEGRLGR